MSQFFPLPAGCGIMRDIRIWHGGVPNSSDEDRHLPVLQFYSDRALELCGINLGRSVEQGVIDAKLSAETQNILCPLLIKREGDPEPVLQGSKSHWPGLFSY